VRLQQFIGCGGGSATGHKNGQRQRKA
jgi:hypothetical protein